MISFVNKQVELSLTSVMDLELPSLPMDPSSSKVVALKLPQLSDLVLVDLPLLQLKVDGADITPLNKHLLTAPQDSHVLMDFALTSTLTLPNLNLVRPPEIDSRPDRTHSSPSMRELSGKPLTVIWLLTECK